MNRSGHDCRKDTLSVLFEIVEIFNTGDCSQVNALFSSGYIDHQNDRDRAPHIEGDGPDEFRQIVAGARKFLPNLKVTLQDHVVEEGKVAARLRWHGSDGIKEISRETIDFLHIVNGMVVEHWGAEQWKTERVL